VTPVRPKLPRKARLSGGKYFTGAFADKRYGRYFVVLARVGPVGEAARLGVVAGKQAAPKAVTRTRMKRLIREVFRQRRHQLQVLDYVVRLRRAAASGELEHARRELETLLSGSR
jgi:ribonuclease P protein component